MLYISLALAAVILGVATYRAYTGNAHARIFLWAWALSICLVAPFIGVLGHEMSAPALVLVATTTIPYLFRLFGKHSQALEDAQSELRRVLAESTRRTEEERLRISRRLHDDINPLLVIAKVDLKHLAELVGDIGDPDVRAKAEELIGRSIESVSTVYQALREVIKATRIEMIDSIGLLAAMQSLVQHYGAAVERPEIVFHTNLKGALQLPRPMASSVYRMVQEAVLNAVKHADAERISVGIDRGSDGRYWVEITDNGKGMVRQSGDGIGLIDLRERAKLIGADLQIESAPKRGTMVKFSFADPDSSNRT